MTVTSTPARQRTRVGWGDLAWLTWRQHRWQLVALAGAVALVALLCLVVTWVVNATGNPHHDIPVLGDFTGAIRMATIAATGFGGLVAVFWAAPLLSREYEQKTTVVVWTQDITPVRWLAGKVVLLGVPAVGLAAALGSALVTAQHALNSVSGDYPVFPPFRDEPFESVPLVQVGYAAFGFALGLVTSAITRRTVLSMGLALGAFIAARVAVAKLWRPYYQTPLREVQPYSASYTLGPQDLHMYVMSGYLDAAGNEIEFPRACLEAPTAGVQSIDSRGDFEQCLRDNGVVDKFIDYQPVERVAAFQLIEFGVFALLAAGLLALAFTWLRRTRRT
ncbi:ABC transporter permease subunit [Saccharothrix algeriensis]|uniref:Transmembrane transport protein n=1 Tax=Saccharothrix algeriensis TaxID=173560 RepID=A0A8T8HSS2_9PSEU|nr:ABC transporter permease subunit [Saccharothrix algeriensis]MBM7812936.1 hypothetical protein [Saccharothrix algeriensis]QTR01575.1 hypothetical protein J7S33_19680 [Saccharothrix algeriensis]